MQPVYPGRWWIVPVLAVLGVAAAGRDAPLIDAVKTRDATALRALLKQQVDVNTPQADGTTALHWAVHFDDLDTVNLLLSAGANSRAVNRYGVAPLSLACLNGNAKIIERLLKAGADANTTQPGGETALMTAARVGNVDALKVLVAHGADVNATESARGQTALMWAAAEGNAAAVDALIKAGAAVDARSRESPDLSLVEPGDEGFTALLFAARAGHINAVRTLLAAGANVNDTSSKSGTSALLLAVLSAQLDTAAFLLDHGADPNAARQGWTALHQVAWTRRPSIGPNTVGPVPRGQVDSLSLVKKLIAHGANINARTTKEPSEIWNGRDILKRIGITPFLLAAHRVDLDLMRLLVASGANPLIPNVDGTTPLMAAAGVGLFKPGDSPGTAEEVAEAVKLCLEWGGDPTTVDANGDTALHGAAYWDSLGAIKLLVAAGAKLDVKNKRGWTPVRVADGVAITASIQPSPESAALLRSLMAQQGLPVPEPVVGVGR